MCNAPFNELSVSAFLAGDGIFDMVDRMDASADPQLGDNMNIPPLDGLDVPDGAEEADEPAASTVTPMSTSSSLALQVIQVCNDKQDAALVQKLLLCPAAVKALHASIASKNASPRALSLCGRKSLMLQVLSCLLALPLDRILPAFDQPGLYVLHVSDDLLVIVLWHEGGDCMDFKSATNCSLVRYVTELAVDVVVCLEEGAEDRLLVTTSSRPAKVKRVHHMRLVVEQVTNDDVAVHNWSTIAMPASRADRCMLAAGGSPKAGVALGSILPPSKKWVNCERGCDLADAPQLLLQLQSQYKVDLSGLTTSTLEVFLRLAAPFLWAHVLELEEGHRKELAAVSGPVDVSAAVEAMHECLVKAAAAVMSEWAAAMARNSTVEGAGGGQQVAAIPDYSRVLEELEQRFVSVYLGRGISRGERAYPEVQAPAAGAGAPPETPAAGQAATAATAAATAAAGAGGGGGAAAGVSAAGAALTAAALPVQQPASIEMPRLVYYGELLHCSKAEAGGVARWLQIQSGSVFNFVFKKCLRLVGSNGSNGKPPSFLILPEKSKARAFMPVCFGDRVTLKFESESINATLVNSDDHNTIGLIIAGQAISLLNVQAEEYNSLRRLTLRHCAGDGAMQRTGFRASIVAAAKRQGCLGKVSPDEWRQLVRKLAVELVTSFGTKSLFEMKRAVAAVEQTRTRGAIVRGYHRRRDELMGRLVEEVRAGSTGTTEAAIKWCLERTMADEFKVRGSTSAMNVGILLMMRGHAVVWPFSSTVGSISPFLPR